MPYQRGQIYKTIRAQRDISFVPFIDLVHTNVQVMKDLLSYTATKDCVIKELVVSITGGEFPEESNLRVLFDGEEVKTSTPKAGANNLGSFQLAKDNTIKVEILNTWADKVTVQARIVENERV